MVLFFPPPWLLKLFSNSFISWANYLTSCLCSEIDDEIRTSTLLLFKKALKTFLRFFGVNLVRYDCDGHGDGCQNGHDTVIDSKVCTEL